MALLALIGQNHFKRDLFPFEYFVGLFTKRPHFNAFLKDPRS